MPGKKTTQAASAHTGQALDHLSNMVKSLEAKLEETHERADALHHKAERLHADVDRLKRKARNRPSPPPVIANQPSRRKAK
jgi:uncharacterized protein YoxC